MKINVFLINYNIKIKYQKFYCGENENILSIKETTTCNYVVVINTPKLCNSPGFESKKSINSILCHPISGKIIYNIFKLIFVV